MNSLENLRKELYDFNVNPKVMSIREKYNTPSFFEMIDKTRSETAHSAFLSWMLKGQGVSDTTADTPLYLFLLTLANRSLEQGSSGNPLMNAKVRDAIFSRRIKITNVTTKTEKLICELAELAYDSFDPIDDAKHRTDLSDIIGTVADRVDIVVSCDVENCDNIKHLIIVVENKVDSDEGQPKSKATAKRGKKIPGNYSSCFQTERYYEASYHKVNSDTEVIYVFLTPKLADAERSILSCNRTELLKKWKCARSDKYININYQDVLNNIIEKVLSLKEGSITVRTKNFLNEYKNEITYPHIDNPKTHVNIAYPKVEGIEELWEKFRFLIHCIAYSTVSKKGCVAVWDSSTTTYINSYNDRVYDLDKLPVSMNVFFTIKSTTVDNFCTILGSNGYNCMKIDSTTLSADDVKMLSDYADENLEILSTIIGAVKYSSLKYADEAVKILEILMNGARDSTKCMVKYKGISLTPKPVAKSEAAFLIFKAWARNYNGPALLSDIRNSFPVSVNPYYANCKYFKHLFYNYSSSGYFYDGVDPRFQSSIPDNSNWDFYHDDSHKYNGITNLKMWRRDAFDSLIIHIKKNLHEFARDLSITDVDDNIIL